MNLQETPIDGLFVVEPRYFEDDRGFFSVILDNRVLKSARLNLAWVQNNVAFNHKAGTLRGMHYQQPHEEIKLVRCTRGCMFDVAIDLRPGSNTFGQWHGVELTQDNHRMFYIPKQFAHGYLTLEDNTEVYYHVSEDYHPESARGVRWNDPRFGIQWPMDPVVINDRDRTYPDFAG